ncbi:MAG: HEAT repeat domain-containing protein [Candidatus Thorarchaeota archaeon]
MVLNSDSESSSPSEVIQVLEGLSNIKVEKEVIDALSNILRNESDLVARSLAIEMLAKYKNNEFVPQILSEILGSPPEGSLVRCAAARALGRVGGVQAREALVKSIKTDTDYPLIVVNSVKALGELGDAKAIPAIVELFASKDDPRCPPYLIRRYAAEALGQIGAKDAVATLKEIHRTDSHSSVREAAEGAIRILSS